MSPTSPFARSVAFVARWCGLGVIIGVIAGLSSAGFLVTLERATELRIAPDGAVTGIRMVSSELKSDTLESKLLARVRQFDFGAKDVEVMVVNWPVDFLPS